MRKITPCLWFDDQAEEAVKFYVIRHSSPTYFLRRWESSVVDDVSVSAHTDSHRREGSPISNGQYQP
jgi:predicted 3-demethylubiquinone-9 3-methyltransferase (glyoxalase superfamily)